MNKNELIDFYKNILDSVGLVGYNESDYITIGNGDDKSLLTINSKFMVLPTKNNIDNLIVKDENGMLSVDKILFNPLRESAIKGNSPSLSCLKTWMEAKLCHSLACVGELLLILAANPELQKNTNLELNKFLSSITEAMSSNIKEIVDNTSKEKWGQIYKKTIKGNTKLLNIFISKLMKVDGEKFSRAAVLSSSLYSELLTATKDTPVYGVKLRNKDIKVFKLIIEYLLQGINNSKQNIIIGSNDPECPAFISLASMYITIGERLNKIAKLVKFIDKETYASCYIDLKFNLKDLQEIGKFKGEVALIPDEVDTNRSVENNNVNLALNNKSVSENKPILNSNVTKKSIPTINTTTPVYNTPEQPSVQMPEMMAPNTIPVQHAHVPYDKPLERNVTSDGGISSIRRYMATRNGPVVTTTQPPQPVFNNQYTYVQQPTQLMGVNEMINNTNVGNMGMRPMGMNMGMNTGMNMGMNPGMFNNGFNNMYNQNMMGGQPMGMNMGMNGFTRIQ